MAARARACRRRRRGWRRERNENPRPMNAQKPISNLVRSYMCSSLASKSLLRVHGTFAIILIGRVLQRSNWDHRRIDDRGRRGYVHATTCGQITLICRVVFQILYLSCQKGKGGLEKLGYTKSGIIAAPLRSSRELIVTVGTRTYPVPPLHLAIQNGAAMPLQWQPWQQPAGGDKTKYVTVSASFNSIYVNACALTADGEREREAGGGRLL